MPDYRSAYLATIYRSRLHLSARCFYSMKKCSVDFRVSNGLDYGKVHIWWTLNVEFSENEIGAKIAIHTYQICAKT